MSRTPALLGAIVAVLVVAQTAEAQGRSPRGTAPAAPAEAYTIRGFGDIGFTRFSAAESFTAILGANSGQVIGGGVEVGLPRHLFVNLRASRFQQDGHRVFVFGGEQFDLHVNTTVTVEPVELTGGYRLHLWPRIITYGGGGIGWHRYRETSDFATDAENVQHTFMGYQLVGGAEFRFSRLVGAAAEAEWAAVPNALGQDANSVAKTFDENDLGGATFRVKIVVGR